MQNDRAKKILEDVLNSAIAHPCFAGFKEDGVSESDINDEGGDVAFITIDIAWRIKYALELILDDHLVNIHDMVGK